MKSLDLCERLERRPLLVLVLLMLLSAMHAHGQETYADWLTATGTSATFMLDTTSGTVTIANPMNGAGNLTSIGALDGTTNYPDVWFSPGAPPVGTEWGNGGVGNLDGANPGGADWVITFSSPITDPRFHFVNLDAATVDFGPTLDTSNNPVVTVRLSGNPEFEVVGDTANATTQTPLAFGCEDALGGNPNGACGTVQLTGTYQTVTFTCTDEDVSLASGDGFAWTVSAELPTEADLSITKTDGVTTATPGGMVTYALVASNAGPADDPSVSVADNFPAPLTCTYTSVAAGGATGNTAAGSGDIADTLDMPAGSSVTYTATCDIDPAATGTLSNTATITGSVSDPDSGNNSGTDDNTTLAPEADLAIIKTDSVDPAMYGSLLAYTIDVLNDGPSDATNVAVTDTLPIGVTFLSVAGDGWTCAEISDVVTCTRPTLPPGPTPSILIEVETPTINVVLDNTVDITSDIFDPDTSDNVAQEDTTVLGSPLEIPTLGEMGLALLAILLSIAAMLSMRRK
ncbi:MAG: DUF11 domain-containing protein [Acidobacteriota bacterium]